MTKAVGASSNVTSAVHVPASSQKTAKRSDAFVPEQALDDRADNSKRDRDSDE